MPKKWTTNTSLTYMAVTLLLQNCTQINAVKSAIIFLHTYYLIDQIIKNHIYSIFNTSPKTC